jgi:hypothetical protein
MLKEDAALICAASFDLVVPGWYRVRNLSGSATLPQACSGMCELGMCSQSLKFTMQRASVPCELASNEHDGLMLLTPLV